MDSCLHDDVACGNHTPFLHQCPPHDISHAIEDCPLPELASSDTSEQLGAGHEDPGMTRHTVPTGEKTHHL